MSIPEQVHPHPYDGGWPANELEETLSASLGIPGAGARLVEVLGRNFVWVPLPNGGSPESPDLDLPTIEIDGGAYVPVFSSEQQFLSCVGTHMSFTVAPAREFARGLPPQLGIALNPGGAVGVPLPPPAVAELCRVGHSPLDGSATGGRVRMFEPDWQQDPVDFLATAAGEFHACGAVLTARRAAHHTWAPRGGSACAVPKVHATFVLARLEKGRHALRRVPTRGRHQRRRTRRRRADELPRPTTQASEEP